MKKLVVGIILLLSFSTTTLSSENLELIKSKINEALETGDMGHQNWEEAALLLEPLLESGNPEALYYTSFFYAFGIAGYPSDMDIAISNEFKAASLGSVTAMLSHARRYEYGVSKPIDFKKSLVWYEKAAQSGSEQAAYRLENAYRNGELGLEKDEALALKWQERAGDCEKP